MPVNKILTNAKKCYGCRTCELVCSFHHEGAFSPEVSSIKISRDNLNGEIELAITPTCDACRGESRPLCVRYCLYGALEEVG